MRKRLINLIVGLVLTSFTYAQSYRIVDYIPDSLTTWLFRPSLALNSSGSTSAGENDFHFDDSGLTVPHAGKNLNFILQPAIDLHYKKITKSREISSATSLTYRRDLVLYLHDSERDMFSIDWSTYENNRDRNMIASFTGSLNWTEYFKSRWGIGAGLSVNAQSSIQEVRDRENTFNEPIFKLLKDYTKSHKDNPSYGLLFGPRLSYGRVYEGQYAAKAEELMAELRKQGRLQRDLSREEFVQLAQLILRQRERYHYDSRIKNLEAMGTIIEYLKTVGAILPNDTKAYLALHDIYLFAPIQSRPFGTKYSIYGSIVQSDDYNKHEYDFSRQECRAHLDSEDEVVEDSLLSSTKTHRLFSSKRFSESRAVGINASYNKIYSWRFWMQLSSDLNYEERENQFQQKDRQYSANDTTIISDRNRGKQSFSRLSVSSSWYYQWDSRSLASVGVGVEWYYMNERQHSPQDVPNDDGRTTSCILHLIPQVKYYLNPQCVLNVSSTNQLTRTGSRSHLQTSSNNYKTTLREWRYSGSINFSLIYYI